MEYVPWQLAHGWRPDRYTRCFRCFELRAPVENPYAKVALMLRKRKEPKRKSIALTLMRDVQGTAAQKLEMFEKVRAAGGNGLALLFGTRGLDPAIRKKPHQGNQHIDRVGHPRDEEGEYDRHDIEDRRNFALEVFANRSRQVAVRAVASDDHSLKDVVGDGRHQQSDAIERRRIARKVILAHPTGRKRNERQPKQEVRVGPQDPPVDLGHRMQ